MHAPLVPSVSLLRARRVGQDLSIQDKATVVAEIKGLLKPEENSIITLRTKEPSLVHKLTDSSLRLLGAKDPAQARKLSTSTKWMHEFLNTLKACLVEGDDCAFPGYEIKNNETNNTVCGRKFKGLYLEGVAYITS